MIFFEKELFHVKGVRTKRDNQSLKTHARRGAVAGPFPSGHGSSQAPRPASQIAITRTLIFGRESCANPGDFLSLSGSRHDCWSCLVSYLSRVLGRIFQYRL